MCQNSDRLVCVKLVSGSPSYPTPSYIEFKTGVAFVCRSAGEQDIWETLSLEHLLRVISTLLVVSVRSVHAWALKFHTMGIIRAQTSAI